MCNEVVEELTTGLKGKMGTGSIKNAHDMVTYQEATC
jgi:hypothetical protein